MRGCTCRAQLGRGFSVETTPCVILQLCPWQSSSHQEIIYCSGKTRRTQWSSWSRERGQGGWEGRRGAEQEEGRSRQQQDLCVFLSCCKDLPADMETGRSFVVNHLKKAAFCPILPILQFLDPTVSVLPCFIYRASTRHITTARSLLPCPALLSSIFLLPDFP